MIMMLWLHEMAPLTLHPFDLCLGGVDTGGGAVMYDSVNDSGVMAVSSDGTAASKSLLVGRGDDMGEGAVTDDSVNDYDL